MTESVPASQGGVVVLVGFDDSEEFTDVRVSGMVNVNPSDALMGLSAGNRLDTADDSQGYSFSVEFAPTADRGTAWFTLAGSSPGPPLVLNSLRDFGIPTRLDIDASYYFEFDVFGGQLTGRVFDAPGGNELLSMSYTDPTPLGPGYAGVAAEHVFDDIPFGGTFDDLSAVSLIKSLMAGDADQDLDFDQQDLVKVQVAAKYLTGQAATWGEGDWDGAPGGTPGNPPAGDGLFNQFDIIAAQRGAIYLTGPYAAVRPNGQAGDGQTSVIYNAGTGEVAVNAPAGVELTSINIDSAAGIFTGEAAQNLGGSFDNDASDNIFKATFGGSFGSLSFGNVAQGGLSEDFVLNDLTVVGSLAGGGDLGEVDLIYVPEPASAFLLVIGVIVASIRYRRSTT